MSRKRVNVVFDIGKTNKKFFLFDSDFQLIDQKQIELPLIEDEDGHPTENIALLRSWIRGTFHDALDNTSYEIQSLNFSTYGATLVHLGHNGDILTPVYNYTKPVEEEVLDEYYKKYGDRLKISVETASPQSGMLNSGIRLYWLKNKHPDTFSRIKTTLHLPQYLSWMFTGIPVSEYTSIGCHTNLWDFRLNQYHAWVNAEGLDRLFGPIVPTATSINMQYEGRRMKVGVGIHDSSAALLPYILISEEPFLLVSTGTWSISLNPYSREVLNEQDLRDNCLNYMRTDGHRVKATRFFMGNEYKIQTEHIRRHFGKKSGYHREVRFDPEIFLKREADPIRYFRFDGFSAGEEMPDHTDLQGFNSFEEAYHQLLLELMAIQQQKIRDAIGSSEIRKIFVDGGFTRNDVFMQMLSYYFSDYTVLSTEFPLGSALGAAMVIADDKTDYNVLKENYRFKQHQPPVLK